MTSDADLMACSSTAVLPDARSTAHEERCAEAVADGDEATCDLRLFLLPAHEMVRPPPRKSFGLACSQVVVLAHLESLGEPDLPWQRRLPTPGHGTDSRADTHRLRSRVPPELAT